MRGWRQTLYGTLELSDSRLFFADKGQINDDLEFLSSTRSHPDQYKMSAEVAIAVAPQGVAAQGMRKNGKSKLLLWKYAQVLTAPQESNGMNQRPHSDPRQAIHHLRNVKKNGRPWPQ